MEVMGIYHQQLIFYHQGKKYQLTVTNNFGCSYTDEIYVTHWFKTKQKRRLYA